ncbi:MAG TPA: type II secretion system protein [Terriglobales bacterium]|nr:type II secretion system protein [Terriglobales bacterium]
MEKQTGFTLAELLIVLVVICLIAAIVFPNLLRSRVAAGEAAAISSVREINKAEVSYETTYPALGFAGTLGSLGPGTAKLSCHARSPEHACLLDPKLSVANTPEHSRNGYWFAVTPAGKDASGVVDGYIVGSAATIYNQTGVRDFCSTEDGVLHFRVPHQQSSPVTTLSECHNQAVLQ